MNKIGIKSIETCGGFTGAFELNTDGEWNRRVSDIRELLKMYDAEIMRSSEQVKLAVFMSFDIGGTFLTIARPIAGRGGDNMAVWLYIPNEISISGSEVSNLVNVVKTELRKTDLDEEKLRQVFSKEYDIVEVPQFTRQSSAEYRFAKILVGSSSETSLEKLLGNDRYQSGYEKYQAILLQDERSLSLVPDRPITDLTNMPRKSTVVLKPIGKETLQRYNINRLCYRKGYETCVDTDFVKPIRVNQGETITITLIRKEFDEIKYSHTVNRDEDEQICSVPEKIEWKKTIRQQVIENCLRVEDEFRKENISPKFSVNGKELPIQLGEKELQSVSIEIVASGYQNEQISDYNLIERKHTIIGLKRAERTHMWKVKLKNGEEAELTYKSKNAPVDKPKDSLLEGYEVSKVNPDKLVYSPRPNMNVSSSSERPEDNHTKAQRADIRRWEWMVVLLLATFLVGGVAGFVVNRYCFSKKDKKEQVEEGKPAGDDGGVQDNTQTPPTKPPQADTSVNFSDTVPPTPSSEETQEGQDNASGKTDAESERERLRKEAEAKAANNKNQEEKATKGKATTTDKQPKGSSSKGGQSKNNFN